MEMQVLENIGLTQNESIVYITLLKLGTSKTGEILKEAHLNSGKIYEILESLKEKGLVSESVMNNIRHFTAAPPVQILDYLNKKKSDLQKNEEKVREIVPALEKMREMKIHETKAVTYTGLRGLQTAADEAIASVKPGERVLTLGVTGKKPEKYNRFWLRWTKKNLNSKITWQYIFSRRDDYFRKFKKMKHAKSRALTGFTPAAVDVFGKETVLLFNYQEPFSCIFIHDKNIAASFTQFFDQLWTIAKP